MKRFGKPPLPGIKYTPRVGVYAIITQGSRILLTEQAEPGLPAEIQLPGGGIDPFEQPLPALHREALEETGWKIAPIRHFGCYRRYTYMPEYDLHAMKVAHIYICRAVYRIGPPSEAFHRAVWADINAAPALLGPVGDVYFTRKFMVL
ncbi:MAG: NUDIX hydrolase [Rhodobacteraceae bacterium]|nr:NUDIX hydrolase [Paracoccaceae bacterium]